MSRPFQIYPKSAILDWFNSILCIQLIAQYSTASKFNTKTVIALNDSAVTSVAVMLEDSGQKGENGRRDEP
jgi:hypothetical protein